ncbi:MAG: DUF2254 family protein [Alcaligenaceae bacterium]|nr:DUF2254 family protein [Alcaligenaceae bacterium]
MLYRFLVYLRKPSNQLWLMPAAGALLAVIFVFAASWVNVFVPPSFLPDINLETLESLLDVIASSMLAVSTFSLSIMVSAFASASNSATPRATELVMSDDNTRMAIASFISAFIYAIIAKIALGLGYYGQNGRFALFIATIFVLLYLIVTLIRWVHTLSQLGRLENTLAKIKHATEKSLLQARIQADMGASRKGEVDAQAHQLKLNRTGFLTHIDMAGLQKQAEASDCYVHIAVRPGEMILPDTVLAYVQANSGSDKSPQKDVLDCVKSMANCFVLDAARSFDQDPSWGFIVLSEAGQRALSSAINDPGTVIRVMNDMLALFVDVLPPEAGEVSQLDYDRLSIAPINYADWVEDAFLPLIRDGAALVEVNLIMQKVLAGIARYAPEQGVQAAAKQVAALALERAQQKLDFESDRERLEAKHKELFH